MSDSHDTYDDLASFDDDYKPEKPFRPGIDTLADGDYEMEIVEANLAHASTGDRVLNLDLRVNGGTVVQHTYWLKTQAGMNSLGADLCTLGFDANKWGKTGGKSIKEALPESVKKLPGIRFKCTKKRRDGSGANAGKVYHDIYINARISGRSMPAASSGFNELPDSAPVNPQPVGAPAGSPIPW